MKKHFERIKSMPCGLCGHPPPSEAHHILSGRVANRKAPDLLTMPLCGDCHRGSLNGIHGQRNMWRVMKKNEQDVLAETVGKLLYEN